MPRRFGIGANLVRTETAKLTYGLMCKKLPREYVKHSRLWEAELRTRPSLAAPDAADAQSLLSLPTLVGDKLLGSLVGQSLVNRRQRCQ